MRTPLIVAAALLTVACAEGETAEAPEAAATPAAEVAAPAPVAPAVTDPQIADIVVAANAVDVQAGELAREKATDPRVKEFAERMITDHTGVNEAAGALVSRLGVTPEPNPTSESLRSGGTEAIAALSQQTGAAFDKAYMDREVAYHQQVLDAIDQTLIPSAQNAELKALLEQTRPAIEAHLKHARELQTSLAGS